MDVNDYRTSLWLIATLPVDTPATDWWLGRCAEYPRQDYTPVVDYRAAIAADPLTGQQYVPEQPQYRSEAATLCSTSRTNTKRTS